MRGMSTITILRELMERLARERGVVEIHPWQEFDMIGGTSTVWPCCAFTISIRTNSI